MDSNFIYYVYAYLRKDGSPYYVGKGRGNRAFSAQHSIKLPPRSRIIFLETNLSNVGALALERRYIKWYGRRDLGTGILYNRTDGGDGQTGLTDSHLQKMINARSGAWNKGIPRTDAQKLHHSMVLKGKMSGENNPNYGVKTSPEKSSKISKSRKLFFKNNPNYINPSNVPFVSCIITQKTYAKNIASRMLPEIKQYF